MPDEKSAKINLPSEFLFDLGLRRRSLAERVRLWRSLKGHEDILGIYEIAPEERVFVEGFSSPRDPLWGAIESRALERAETSRQLVTQGTLAYVHADDIPYRVERYIPVDIYLEETDVASLAELNGAVRDLFETLGFEYISYPAIAKSSARNRGALRTRPMTPEELKKTESGIAKGFYHLNGKKKEGRSTPKDHEQDEKALLQLAKLQLDVKLSEQEIKRSEAETKRAEAERSAALMDKRNKLTSLLLGIGGTAVITIGTLVMTSTGPAYKSDPPVDPPKVVRWTPSFGQNFGRP